MRSGGRVDVLVLGNGMHPNVAGCRWTTASSSDIPRRSNGTKP